MSKVSALVVDDAPFIRDLMKKGLRDNFPGLHIEEAVNGRKAQQLLSRQNVDLILCDWEMPEMSGLELLTWCRAQENLKTTRSSWSPVAATRRTWSRRSRPGCRTTSASHSPMTSWWPRSRRP